MIHLSFTFFWHCCKRRKFQKFSLSYNNNDKKALEIPSDFGWCFCHHLSNIAKVSFWKRNFETSNHSSNKITEGYLGRGIFFLKINWLQSFVRTTHTHSHGVPFLSPFYQERVFCFTLAQDWNVIKVDGFFMRGLLDRVVDMAKEGSGVLFKCLRPSH